LHNNAPRSKSKYHFYDLNLLGCDAVLLGEYFQCFKELLWQVVPVLLGLLDPEGKGTDGS